MSRKDWRIVGIVVLTLIFIARLYFTWQRKKERDDMVLKLIRTNSQDINKKNREREDSIFLDSLNKKAKADREAFEKTMKEQ